MQQGLTDLTLLTLKQNVFFSVCHCWRFYLHFLSSGTVVTITGSKWKGDLNNRKKCAGFLIVTYFFLGRTYVRFSLIYNLPPAPSVFCREKGMLYVYIYSTQAFSSVLRFALSLGSHYTCPDYGHLTLRTLPGCLKNIKGKKMSMYKPDDIQQWAVPIMDTDGLHCLKGYQPKRLHYIEHHRDTF